MGGGEEARTKSACPLICGVDDAGPPAEFSSSALRGWEPEPERHLSQAPSWKDLSSYGAR